MALLQPKPQTPQQPATGYTPGLLEEVQALGVPTEWVAGITRFRIYPNSVRDGSGNYAGVGIHAEGKYDLQPGDPRPAAVERSLPIFRTRLASEVKEFYDLIQRSLHRHENTGQI